MKTISINNFFNLSCILFCLIPVSLISGPFIPDLFLTLIISFNLFIFFKKDQYDQILKTYICISLIFYFFIVLSSLTSEILISSLKSSLFLF